MAFAYTIIRRFHAGALTATALALLSLAAALPEPASAKSPARPNVVVIVTDDQAAHALRRDAEPPLDRIGGIATSFTNAIVTTPPCCPSRASMLTGQYGHNNGVLRNDYRQPNAKGNILPRGCSASVPDDPSGSDVARRRTRAAAGARRRTGGHLQEPNTYYDYKLSVDGRSHRYGTRRSRLRDQSSPAAPRA